MHQPLRDQQTPRRPTARRPIARRTAIASAAVVATLAGSSVAWAAGCAAGGHALANTTPTPAGDSGGAPLAHTTAPYGTEAYTTPRSERAPGSPAGDTSDGSTTSGPTSPAGQIEDHTPPNVALKLPATKQLHDRSAYRTLLGTVADPFSGVANVEIAVYRAKPHATALSFTGKTFRTVPLATAKASYVKVFVADSAWSLGLPGLTAGKYVVLLRATDVAGNVSPISTTKLSLH